MGAKEDKKLKDKKLPEKRSKSADNKWSAITNNRLTNAVSRSLPTISRLKKDADATPKTIIEKPEKKKRRRKKKNLDDEANFSPDEPPKPKIIIPKEDKRKKTLWRHIMWLVVLFAYSLLGGLLFSAIEGGYDKVVLLSDYERSMTLFRRRHNYQSDLISRFREIARLKPVIFNNKGRSAVNKTELLRHALEWYERKLGFTNDVPVQMDTKWNLWGGVYYAASLYTTIGYGNFHPKTNTGRIVSMLYASVGIPLVFTILLEWGFLYFTWIEYGWNWLSEKFCQKSLQRQVEKRYLRERVRRVGSELSLRSMSTVPLLSVHRTTSNQVNTIDHQIESNKPLKELDIVLADQEQAQTVPMKAALIFFVMWLCFSAFIVRLWEYEWTYFTAFYFFFTSLTTIGLGDVVTKTPNFIIFNLAMTLIGLSVVGLCVAIVQAKVRLVFDRMIRSIDSQYRIRQIDPDVATMTIITDENEGVKRLIEAQPIQDRIIFLFMDEHKKSMLKERWRQRSSMTNKITQTYPSRADKYVQTGNRVYDQPLNSDEDYDSEWEDEEESEASSGEYDEAGNKIFPPSTKRYIYTVFD
ncbi:unnamed protein product [Auanema sp. JU1783]|nr:unnamed protein product [Auanema sp. JU1783]